MEFAAFQHTETPVEGWAKWAFFAWTLVAFYCIFNRGLRNLLYSECYKWRGMKNTGSPASVRTATIAFVLSLGVFVSLFAPGFWQWDYSGALVIALYAIVMLSSYLDARDYRNGKLR